MLEECGRMQKTVGLWTRKTVKLCKCGLVRHPTRSLETINSAEINVNYEVPAPEFSEGNSTSNWQKTIMLLGQECGFLSLS